MASLQIKSYNFSKPPNKQSNYSHRINHERWQDMMPIIIDMFREGLTRKMILRSLRAEYSFNPSMGQLVYHMTQWHMRRYKLSDTTTSIDDSPTYSCASNSHCIAELDFEPPGSVRLSYREVLGFWSPRLVWAIRQTEKIMIYELGKLFLDKRLEMSVRKAPSLGSHSRHTVFGGLRVISAFSRFRCLMEFSGTPEIAGFLTRHIGPETIAGKPEYLQVVLGSKDCTRIYDLTTLYAMVMMAAIALLEKRWEETALHTNAALVVLSGIRHELLKHSSQWSTCLMQLERMAMAIQALPNSHSNSIAKPGKYDVSL